MMPAGAPFFLDDIMACGLQVRLAAKTGVVADIREKGDYAGFPAVSGPSRTLA